MVESYFSSTKSRYWQNWLSLPWHGWILSDSKALAIWQGTISSIPDDTAIRLLSQVWPIVALPPPHQARAIRLQTPLPAGVRLIQVDSTFLERPLEQAQAILAHELAHLCLAPSSSPEIDDLQADQLAASWGWTHSLHEALQADAGAHHPRTKAIEPSKQL